MPVLLLFFRQVKPALWKVPLWCPLFVWQKNAQAARLVGCSNDLINSWMKKEEGLRFVRVQNGVFTTKEWLIDYFAHYTKEKNQRYRISK